MKCLQLRHVLAVVVTSAIALTGCSGGEDAKNSDTGASASRAAEKPAEKPADGAAEAPAADAARKDVKVTKSGFEDHQTWGPGAYVVHYEVTNQGRGAASYYAELEFLDKDGDHLGQTGITADKLGQGKVSTGNTAPLDAEIRNGKIKDIRSVRVTKVDRTTDSQ
ncbi:hypothetical protein [Streptomyces sp. NPDC102437]|uniref:hypothetical protein n=1 Tax=Streptomyces sp. NPDC102437 TaxID=3366175 RepID=UPI0037F906D9